MDLVFLSNDDSYFELSKIRNYQCSKCIHGDNWEEEHPYSCPVISILRGITGLEDEDIKFGIVSDLLKKEENEKDPLLDEWHCRMFHPKMNLFK